MGHGWGFPGGTHGPGGGTYLGLYLPSRGHDLITKVMRHYQHLVGVVWCSVVWYGVDTITRHDEQAKGPANHLGLIVMLVA